MPSIISNDQTGAIFKAAAIAILALVGFGGEKLRQHIAMRAMHFDAIETGGLARASPPR